MEVRHGEHVAEYEAVDVLGAFGLLEGSREAADEQAYRGGLVVGQVAQFGDVALGLDDQPPEVDVVLSEQVAVPGVDRVVADDVDALDGVTLTVLVTDKAVARSVRGGVVGGHVAAGAGRAVPCLAW